MRFIIVIFFTFYCGFALKAQDRKDNNGVYHMKSTGITLEINKEGNITGLVAVGSKTSWLVSGRTFLKGFRITGDVSIKSLAKDGSYVFSRTMKDSVGHSCIVTDIFTPDKNSIRWDIAIKSNDAPWTTSIVTQMKCANPDEKLIWTAWGSPDFSGTQLTPALTQLVQSNKESKSGTWNDPLTPVSFMDHNWHYGNISQACPIDNDYVALPLFTMLSPSTDEGVSLILSPADVLLDMDLKVNQDGQFQYARTNYRLGNGKIIKFTMHLISHEASWRGGLRFISQRYPEFFEAPNPNAHKIVACGAYSGCESPIDIARMKKMAFGFNWKLSDDFPYMGMFIPPVKNVDEKWKRSCAEPRPEGKTDSTSCRQLNNYAKYMKQNGFSVLNYFNVTEFGKDINPELADLPNGKANDPELWKDGSAYMKVNFPNAWLKVAMHNKTIYNKPLSPILEKPLPDGLKGIMSNCYGAAIVDPGDPAYLKFMLKQAERHIKLIPDADGICIDRNDWVSMYNSNADDGVSWIDGKPARSLYLSWKTLMSELGPLMHKADKVILSNLMAMRIELCSQLDGIYTEFGQNANALNASALMGIRKPVVAWTVNETLQDPNPDAFMQRNLYLGVFPTAPYPTNNHCIMPEPSADKLYMDYGPLLDAMRGKKWVLEPNCVESTTQGVKVNLFEVPYGYAVPVTFGGTAESAVVIVRNIKGLDKMKISVIQPGIEHELPVESVYRERVLELKIPLKRGCGMVLLVKQNKYL